MPNHPIVTRPVPGILVHYGRRNMPTMKPAFPRVITMPIARPFSFSENRRTAQRDQSKHRPCAEPLRHTQCHHPGQMKAHQWKEQIGSESHHSCQQQYWHDAEPVRKSAGDESSDGNRQAESCPRNCPGRRVWRCPSHAGGIPQYRGKGDRVCLNVMVPIRPTAAGTSHLNLSVVVFMLLSNLSPHEYENVLCRDKV